MWLALVCELQWLRELHKKHERAIMNLHPFRWTAFPLVFHWMVHNHSAAMIGLDFRFYPHVPVKVGSTNPNETYWGLSNHTCWLVDCEHQTRGTSVLHFLITEPDTGTQRQTYRQRQMNVYATRHALIHKYTSTRPNAFRLTQLHVSFPGAAGTNICWI